MVLDWGKGNWVQIAVKEKLKEELEEMKVSKKESMNDVVYRFFLFYDEIRKTDRELFDKTIIKILKL